MSKKYKFKKKIIIESTLVFFIAISPFLFKFYDYLPKEDNSSVSFLGITIDSNGFNSVSTYVWFMMSKIIPLYLLILWFLTSKDWWYHIIIIPIAMYAFQIFEERYSQNNIIDSENILWLLPVCMVVIPIVYLIRVKLYDKHVHGIDLEAMEAEIKTIKDKRGISELKDHSKSEEKSEPQETKGYQSFSELLDEKLSTQNLELQFRRFQHSLKNWLHLKF